MLKIWEEEAVPDEELRKKEAASVTTDGAAGTVVLVEKDAFYVQTGDGILKISAVQPEGKKRMTVKDYLLGYQIKVGEKLGE